MGSTPSSLDPRWRHLQARKDDSASGVASVRTSTQSRGWKQLNKGGKGMCHAHKGKHAGMSSTRRDRNDWIAAGIVVLLPTRWDGCCKLLGIVLVEEDEKVNRSGLSRLGQEEMVWADKKKILV